MATEKSKPSESGHAGPKPGLLSPSNAQDIFDVRKIRRLVELMKEHDLSQIDLRQGDTRIQLQRGSTGSGDVSVRPAHVAVPAASAPAAAEKAAAPKAEDDKNIALVRSPMVGTFYSAPDPESPAYVKVGDHVGPETTVCIIEAMKVFNEIQAEVSGKITATLVENGEPVEFGQPLFKVDTRG